jgi:hypothetical protein
MGIADIAINGSYWPYAYLVLLQISIVYLQRPDQARRLGRTDLETPAFYAVATGLIGTALNWLSWLASAYVAKTWGLPSGAAFFIVGMAGSVIANVVMPRGRWPDLIGHAISLPATIFLVRTLLVAINVPPGF